MQTIIMTLVLGSLALDAAILGIIASLFNRPMRDAVMRLIRAYGVLAIFLLSATSIAGTLFLQYADLLSPCILCWWQRIFMYPIGIISLIALVRGRRLSDMSDYVIVLSALGFVVALYQHLLQILPSGLLAPCDASGDCAVRLIFEFGFVTIPWMALSVFALIALVAFLGSWTGSRSQP